MARYGDSTFHGNKNSGDKPDSVKFAKKIDLYLANGIYNQEIKNLSEKQIRTLEEIKTLIMPVVVKGIVEEKRIELNTPKPILYGIVPNDNSDKKDNADEEKDKDLSGRNSCIKNE